MLKRDIEKLNNNRLILIKRLILSDNFYQALRDYGTLNKELELEIRERPSGSRVGHMLDVVCKRGPNSFDALLNALYVTNQLGSLAELEPGFEGKRTALESLSVRMSSDDLKVEKMIENISLVAPWTPATTTVPADAVKYNEELTEHQTTFEQVDASNTPFGVLSLAEDHISDIIKEKISLSKNIHEDEIKSITNNNFLLDIFSLKTESHFVAGYDLSLLQKLGHKFCRKVTRLSDLDKNLNEISQTINSNTLSSCIILIDSCCTKDSLILKEKPHNISLIEVLTKICSSVKTKDLVVMLSLYGSQIFEPGIVSRWEGNKSKDAVVMISQMEASEKTKHWILWAFALCLKFHCSSKATLRDVCSFMCKVGMKSEEKKIISKFHSLNYF